MNHYKLQIEEVSNPKEVVLLRSLECPIDNMIPLDQAVVCKKCETIYCQDCIDKWKKTNNICPMRCSPMELSDFRNTILAQQMDKIKVKCKNEEYGCFEKVLLKDQTSHLTKCLYNIIECSQCHEKVCEGFFINHLMNDCKSMMIKCFVCLTKLHVSELQSHLKSCQENHYLCKECSEYHSSNESNSESKCKLKIGFCKKCELPDLTSNLGTQSHICLLESLRDKEISVQNYLLQLTVRIENQIEKRSNAREAVYVTFILEIEKAMKVIGEKLSRKLNGLISKKDKIQEEISKKILNVNQNKVTDIFKLIKENRLLSESNISKYLL